MIEEQFVSFDTAKLLKEAGFDVPCTSHYTCNGFGWDNLSRVNYNSCESLFSRPTQALAARWLREVHEIDVVVNIYARDYYMCNVYKKRLMIIRSIESSFEEALEAGLQEAIKLIKK